MIHSRPLIFLTAVALVLAWASPAAFSQSLDDRLDQESFLEGLVEYGLDDLLEYYLDASGEDDPALPALVRIARLRAEILQPRPGLEPRARDEAIENLLAAQRVLLDEFSMDDRVPLWQADLAFDLLFLAGGESGVDLVAEFGLLDPATRLRYRAWVQEALDRSNDAIDGVADLVLDLEEDPEFATDAALQQRHRFLVRVEQHQRLPLLLETARYRLATLGEEEADSGADPAVFERIAAGLSFVLGNLDDPWRGRVMALIGLCQARSGNVSDATETIDRVLALRGIEPLDRLRAELAQVLLRAGEDGAAGALAYLDELETTAAMSRDTFASLLIADQKFRWRLVERKGSPQPTAGNLSALIYAIEGYEKFLAQDGLGMNRSQREQLIAERLARVIPPSVPDESLPSFMTLARAEALLRDPETAALGLRRLMDLRESDDVSATVRPRLLLVLAAALQESGRRRDAVETLLEMAASFPHDERAPSAARQAAILAGHLHRDHAENEAARSLYGESLTLLVDQFPTMDGIDAWVYERGRFELRYGEAEEAARLFRLITPGPPIYADAQFQLAVIALQVANDASNARTANTDELMQAPIDQTLQARRVIEQDLQESATDPERVPDLKYYLNALDHIEAEAHWSAGRAEAALALLAGFEHRDNTTRDLRAEAVGLRLEIMRKTGRDADADDQLRAFAENEPNLALDLLARRTADLQARLSDLQAAGRLEEMQALAQEQAAPLCKLAWDTVSQLADGSEDRFPFLFRYAEASRFSGNYEQALALLQTIDADHANAAAVLASRAECHFALEQFESAMPLYQRLVVGLASDRTGTYWLSELRCLEILDRLNRNTEQIYPRIRRLRQIDPDLGGPRFTRAFARLEQLYAP